MKLERLNPLAMVIFGSVLSLSSVLLYSGPLAAQNAKSSGGYSLSDALAYANSGDSNGLYEYAKRWTRDQPTNGYAWFCLGKGASGLKRFEDAAAALRRTTELLPGEGFPYHELAAAYSELNKAEKAMQAIDDGEAKAASRLSARDWYLFGKAQTSFHRFEKAIFDFQNAIRIAPDFSDAWDELGVTYRLAGKMKEAKESFERAQSLGNADAVSHLAEMESGLTPSLPKE